MFLKSGLEACWWVVLQPAQVVVEWSPERSSLGLVGSKQGLGTAAGLSSVRRRGWGYLTSRSLMREKKLGAVALL